MSQNIQKRRLEKGSSRPTLAKLSGVAATTIAKFEQKHTISLASFVAIAKALGYTKKHKGTSVATTVQYNGRARHYQ